MADKQASAPGLVGQIVGYLTKWTFGVGNGQTSESEEDNWEISDFNKAENTSETKDTFQPSSDVSIENDVPVSQQDKSDTNFEQDLAKNNQDTDVDRPEEDSRPVDTDGAVICRDQSNPQEETSALNGSNAKDKKTAGSCKKRNKRRAAAGKKAGETATGAANTESLEAKNGPKARQKGKKPPMRTARDVINRIQWDRNLPEDYFDIGYVDRFLGVVEKPFTAFTWGDLAWIDYDALGIPQHRIEYFKYRGSIVWNKSERLDAVFGSSGTDDDIEMTMTRIDGEIEAERERKAAEREANAALALLREEADNIVGSTSNIDADLFPDDSDDDEEGSDVKVGFLQPVTSPSGGIFGVPEEERSTHFIAVRITDPHVQQRAVVVQRAVVEHDPALSTCAMRSTLFHVTLCMLRLQDAEAVAAAGDCMAALVDELEATLRADDGTLRMRGLRTFGSRVLYTPVSPCSSFSMVNEEVRRRLRHVPGVTLTNSFDYVPHMTLVKVSRPVARLRRSKFIDSAGYQSHEKCDFGSQRFDNLHLCAIDADCALDGFYVTARSINF